MISEGDSTLQYAGFYGTKGKKDIKLETLVWSGYGLRYCRARGLLLKGEYSRGYMGIPDRKQQDGRVHKHGFCE